MNCVICIGDSNAECRYRRFKTSWGIAHAIARVFGMVMRAMWTAAMCSNSLPAPPGRPAKVGHATMFVTRFSTSARESGQGCVGGGMIAHRRAIYPRFN